MKKKIFLIIALVTLTTSAFSQFGAKAGFALGEPLNDNTNNILLGFHIGATYDITENITAELLLESITRKETITIPFFGTIETRNTITPITVGAQYSFLNDKIQPYAGFNLGIYRLSGQVDNTKNTESYFGIHPKVGINFSVAENILVDISAKYHVIFTQQDAPDNSNNLIFGGNIGLIYKIN